MVLLRPPLLRRVDLRSTVPRSGNAARADRLRFPRSLVAFPDRGQGKLVGLELMVERREPAIRYSVRVFWSCQPINAAKEVNII